MINAEPWSNQ